jgi:hypothetical protein
VSTTDLTNTGVFEAIGKPHLPPGPLMVAEAAASATMLEGDRVQPTYRTFVRDGLAHCSECHVCCLPHLSFCQYRGMPL